MTSPRVSGQSQPEGSAVGIPLVKDAPPPLPHPLPKSAGPNALKIVGTCMPAPPKHPEE